MVVRLMSFKGSCLQVPVPIKPISAGCPWACSDSWVKQHRAGRMGRLTRGAPLAAQRFIRSASSLAVPATIHEHHMSGAVS